MIKQISSPHFFNLVSRLLATLGISLGWNRSFKLFPLVLHIWF